MRRFPLATIVIALGAIIAAGLTYFDAARLGFIWDDYFVLRPRPWSELLRVWHGSWDITGLSAPFFRPLAVWADTAAFAAFGFNETALRLTALAELCIGAWLIGEFVRREAVSTWLGAYAAVLFAVHPAVSQSAGPWWFEQNHRLSVIAVAATLLAWQSRRRTLTWLAWWPVHLCILVGSWFKEDVLMLAPILLLFQWWRARTERDVPRPTAAFAARIAAAWAVWFMVRWYVLGAIAGQPMGGPVDEWSDRLRHAVRGLWLTFVRVRAMQGETAPVHQVATAALLAATVSALVIGRRASARARLLMGYGLISGFAFNLPVAIASFPTRYHLIAIGAVLFLTGVAVAWADAARRADTARVTINAVAAKTACAAIAIVLLLSSRANMRIYAPCTAANLFLDRQLHEWLQRTPYWSDSWILPWLDEKAARCADGRDIRIATAIPDVLRRVRAGRR